MRWGHNVAMYSPENIGLGHLRRNILVAHELLARDPNCNILLFANSPVAPFFKTPEQMDHVKLPSARKLAAGDWGPARLRIGKGQLRAMRADLLKSALLQFRPDLFLVDHMPAGVLGELQPALKALKHEQANCFTVLGLRDILDAPAATARAWEREGARDALRHYYDRILIYGSEEMFPTSHAYDLPVPPAGLHYCGYLVDESRLKPAREVRAGLGIGSERFVFVSAGGGNDGEQIMRTYVDAIRWLGPRADFFTLIAVGANAPPTLTGEIEAAARDLPIRVVPFVQDSPSHIAAADLVVCMAGYNTVAEVLHLKKKALVVPRSGPSAEQRIRATLLAERRLIDVLDPDELTPTRMAERLEADLGRSDLPAASGAPRLDGAGVAAERLLELLREGAYAATA